MYTIQTPKNCIESQQEMSQIQSENQMKEKGFLLLLLFMHME